MERLLTGKEWFGKWFNSPYYHILYKHRDQEEAKVFIDNLIKHAHLFPGHKVLDLACGKGRHAIYLNQKGLDTVGVDLSKQNIEFATNFENDRLHFFVHDMRQVFRENEFDFIVNLFTSFGYFDTDVENEQVVHAAARSLKPGGKLLIDFLNPNLVLNNLVLCENKQIEGIKFNISRQIRNGFIFKDISFTDSGKYFEFQERVKAISEDEFRKYFKKADLNLLAVYGDYMLSAYSCNSSPRMIFLAEK